MAMNGVLEACSWRRDVPEGVRGEECDGQMKGCKEGKASAGGKGGDN